MSRKTSLFRKHIHSAQQITSEKHGTERSIVAKRTFEQAAHSVLSGGARYPMKPEKRERLLRSVGLR